MSLVVFLNDVERNGMTVFPLARRLDSRLEESDPTDVLAAQVHHMRDPPAGAAPGSQPEPYWRFISRAFEYVKLRERPKQLWSLPERAAHDTYERAMDICKSGAWDHLKPRAGDVSPSLTTSLHLGRIRLSCCVRYAPASWLSFEA